MQRIANNRASRPPPHTSSSRHNNDSEDEDEILADDDVDDDEEEEEEEEEDNNKDINTISDKHEKQRQLVTSHRHQPSSSTSNNSTTCDDVATTTTTGSIPATTNGGTVPVIVVPDGNDDDDDDDDGVIKVVPWYILPTIVISQFTGTALWFATNAILPALQMDDRSISMITSAVQIGFIIGTLFVALSNIADHTPSTRLFVAASIIGSILNSTITYWHTIAGLITIRLLTGICLAGIYPIGMKIASDWYPQPGKALGYLVGALVLGTAIPFLLDAVFADRQPRMAVLWETSALAAIGGIGMVCIVPASGPYHKPGTRLGDPMVIVRLFRTNAAFRGAAFGYFGHMWEAYAFWTWCAMVWKSYLVRNGIADEWDYNMITFAVIVSGTFGCIIGGHVSQYAGSAIVAFVSLTVSGMFCLVSPLLYVATNHHFVLGMFLLWGAAVAADSPQFSSLIARSVPPENRGTALTIVNCLGFAITVLSIQLLGVPVHKKFCFFLLAPGPVFGLYSMRRHVFERVKPTATQPTDDGHDEAVSFVP